MENRLQPGSGNSTARVALFTLLCALSLALLGIYGFYRGDGMRSHQRTGRAEPHPAPAPLQIAESQSPLPDTSPIPRKPLQPSRVLKKTSPVPQSPPVQGHTSESVLDAMAQTDPEDPEEQGEDIAILKDERAANPTALAPALALVRRLMLAGRHAEAEQELRAVLHQYPTHLAARHQLGSTLAAQNRKEEALQEWRTLVAAGDPIWRNIAQGAIARINSPQIPDIATPDTPIPDLQPARAVVPLQQ